MNRIDHLLSHCGTYAPKREAVALILPLLLEPLSQDEIAERIGYTRRMVEHYWEAIRDDLGINGTPGHFAASRVALLRMALGIDPCFCEHRPQTVVRVVATRKVAA